MELLCSDPIFEMDFLGRQTNFSPCETMCAVENPVLLGILEPQEAEVELRTLHCTQRDT